MKDSELRALVLQVFYDQRKGGYLGINTGGVPPLQVDGMNEQDVLRISAQLGEYGLIEWNGIDGSSGDLMAGVGKINAFGVDVIEGERQSPLPIQIDQSQHVQHIHIEGQHGGVQVAGAHSHQEQSNHQHIEKLISAIDGASVSEADKQKAKGLLATFLQSSAAGALFGPAVGSLLKHCGL